MWKVEKLCSSTTFSQFPPFQFKNTTKNVRRWDIFEWGNRLDFGNENFKWIFMWVVFLLFWVGKMFYFWENCSNENSENIYFYFSEHKYIFIFKYFKLFCPYFMQILFLGRIFIFLMDGKSHFLMWENWALWK